EFCPSLRRLLSDPIDSSRASSVPCPSPEACAEFIIGRRFAPTRWLRLRPLPASAGRGEGSPLPWVERVAQAVADEVERQHREEDRKPRPYRHPRRGGQKALRRIQHAAPGRRRRLLPQA